MPKRGKYKKVKNQPSVSHLLSATTSAKSGCANNSCSGDSARSAMEPVENNNLTPKKRRRETGDSTESSPTDSVNTLKKNHKKPKTMENNSSVKTVHENNENNESTLSDEMQQLERRITDNIMNHNSELLKSMIQETMKEILKPIQDKIDNLLVLKTNMENQEGHITQLKCENVKLNNKLTHIKSEMCNFQRKINQLEDRSLERNLIFQGISETIPDDVEARVDKIYNAISNTISRDTQEERLKLARDIEIIKTR